MNPSTTMTTTFGTHNHRNHSLPPPNHGNIKEEAAASYLITMKHQRLTREECRVTSDVFYSILKREVTTEECCNENDNDKDGVTATHAGVASVGSVAISNDGRKDASFQSSDGSKSKVHRIFDSNDDAISNEIPPASASSASSVPTYPSGMPISLSTEHDAEFLSPLQCYIRSHCTEYFAATLDDSTGGDTNSNDNDSNMENASNSKNSNSSKTKASKSKPPKTPKSKPPYLTPGRRTPVLPGRVGIRCAFCHHLPPQSRASQSISFPSQVHGIYSSVVMMQCRHFPNCGEMPVGVRERIAELKRVGNGSVTNGTSGGNGGSGGGSGGSGGSAGRQKYWAESAKESGFYDTDGGIRFRRPGSDCKLEHAVGEIKMEPISSTNEVADRGTQVPNVVTSTAIAAVKAVAAVTPSESRRPKVVTPVEESLPASIKYEARAKQNHKFDQNQCITASKSRNATKSSKPSKANKSNKTLPNSELTLDQLVHQELEQSPLLSLTDKDLVQGHIYLSLAQMTVCYLTKDDQIGAYKSRTIGSIGICCKHCRGNEEDAESARGGNGGSGGNVGNGRGNGGNGGNGRTAFFPNSARSLAQTTTTQSIIQHVAYKCPSIPIPIRRAVCHFLSEAQKEQKDGKAAYARSGKEGDGRPRYGSRKEFFNRVYERLHWVAKNGKSGKGGKSGKSGENGVDSVENGVGIKGSIVGTDAVGNVGGTEADVVSEYDESIITSATSTSATSATSIPSATSTLSSQDPKDRHPKGIVSLKKKLFHPIIRQVVCDVSLRVESDNDEDEHGKGGNESHGRHGRHARHGRHESKDEDSSMVQDDGSEDSLACNKENEDVYRTLWDDKNRRITIRGSSLSVRKRQMEGSSGRGGASRKKAKVQTN